MKKNTSKLSALKLEKKSIANLDHRSLSGIYGGGNNAKGNMFFETFPVTETILPSDTAPQTTFPTSLDTRPSL